jgi:cytolysin-activating lysine-acyltransferase
MTLEAAKKETETGGAAQSAANMNGAASPPPARKASVPARGLLGSPLAQSFAQIVAVLMRDPSYKDLRVADLEWLVLPPVMAGQFRLCHASPPADKAEAQKAGAFVPVAVALWARVSPQIDKALSENLEKPVRLTPGAWTSGDIPWLMAVAGDRRATQAFLKQLQENEFKGTQVKMRLRMPDGKLVITSLDQHAQAA